MARSRGRAATATAPRASKRTSRERERRSARAVLTSAQQPYNSDRYVALQTGVARPVHLSHTTGAEQRYDFVRPIRAPGTSGSAVLLCGGRIILASCRPLR